MEYEIDYIEGIFKVRDNTKAEFKEISEGRVKDGWSLHSFNTCVIKSEDNFAKILTIVWQKGS